MKFGEKLQRLRRQQGLSQEQLAAQLTVTRQAVSKWELGDAMPETENVVQLSRLFGVSTDSLLYDDLELGQDAPVTRRRVEEEKTQIRLRSSFAGALTVCAIGLVEGGSWLISGLDFMPVIGLLFQIFGVFLFELITSWYPNENNFTRRTYFYSAACWLLAPIPVGMLWLELRRHLSAPWRFNEQLSQILIYLLVCVTVTTVLTCLRKKHAEQ